LSHCRESPRARSQKEGKREEWHGCGMTRKGERRQYRSTWEERRRGLLSHNLEGYT